VTELRVGSQPTNLVSVNDVSLGWVENQSFIYPYFASNTSFSSQGSLGFGLPARPRSTVFCHYSYIAGFFNDTLGANSLAAATSITVNEPTGLTVGTKITIYDGAETENVTVASNYVFGSTTVPLSSPTQYAHASGISVSALPPAIKQAAILVTTAMIKVRGDNSLTMAVISSPTSPNTGAAKDVNNDISMAMDILKPYRRIR
jgi:hypothetical protein